MAVTRRIEDVVEAIADYYPHANLTSIQRAYVYSAKVHAGQVRQSGEPYLTHPLEVAFLLTQMRLDEASIATGLLHDTVEDTLTTLDDLRESFGAEVATLVDGVTKLSKMRFDTDEHKQAENFRKMLFAMAKDIRVVLIKLADRLHNMRTLEYLHETKRARIAQETMDIYAPLANRLGINWLKSELEDQAFCYLQPDAFADLRTQVEALKVERESYVEEVIHIIREELHGHGLPAQVSGRPKHLHSIQKKMNARGIGFDEVYDVIAFRVILDTVGQCYEALGHVHAIWRPIPGRFKDYVAMPKPNEYQSLHTSAIGPGGERIEIQIRTGEMHRVAEDGIAAHWEYKESNLGAKGKKQFAWLRQLLEWQQDLKDPNEFLDIVKYDLFTDEVFVFTPRGEVISLKRGATPVDFAFAIHTEVGTHCAGARVNGRMVPLRYDLKNGDMVEIITNAQQRPSRDWLSFVCTGRARTKIRGIVRAEERARSKELGKEMLERDLRRNQISLQKLLKSGALAVLAAESKHRSLDGLFIALGYGRTTTSQVLEKLSGDLKPAAPPAAPAIQRQTKAKSRRISGGVLVQGIDDVLVRYGKCCSPLPGDAITGFVTRGRGITVHRANCSRALDMDPARRIDVRWDPDGSHARPISLRVHTLDRTGILAHISQTFTNHGINISQANCKVTAADRAINTFEVVIQDAEQLRKVVQDIKGLNGVVGVERL